MNNLAKLHQLIDEGEEVLNTKKSSNASHSMTVNSGSTTVSWYNEPIEVNKVEAIMCNNWFLKVHSLLEKFNLNNFIHNQVVNDAYGNYSEFKLQLENVNNLYELAQYLNNKKLYFKTTYSDIEKNILSIISSVENWQSYLSTYQKIIGYDNFKEVMNDLNDKGYFNFNIKYCYNHDIVCALKGNMPISMKGMNRLKYLNSCILKIKYFAKENWKFIFGIGSISIAIIISVYIVMNNIHQQNIVAIKDAENNSINIRLNNNSEQTFQNTK